MILFGWLAPDRLSWFGALPPTVLNSQRLFRVTCIQAPPSHEPSFFIHSVTSPPRAASSAMPSSQTSCHWRVASPRSAFTLGVKNTPPPHIAPANAPLEASVFLNCGVLGHVFAFSMMPRFWSIVLFGFGARQPG